MKKQSEAEWLARIYNKARNDFWGESRSSEERFKIIESKQNIGVWIAEQVIAALKRRGWTPPKKGKGKK